MCGIQSKPHQPSTITGWSQRLGERLAPQSYFTRSKDDLRRARLVMFFGLLCPIVAMPLSVVQLLFGSQYILWVLIASGVLGPLAIVLMRGFRSVAIGAHMITALVAVSVTTVSLVRGGYGQPIVMTFLIVPLLGLVLGGQRAGLWWLFISVALMCGLGITQLVVSLPPAPLSNPLITTWISHVAFLFIAYLLMFAHNRLRAKAMEDQRAADDRLLDSERRREASETEAQLLRASRLMDLGTLAAGVAHEINNPLTYVHGNIEYLQEVGHSLPEAERKEVLDEALGGTQRIKRIVQDIGAFSHAENDEDPQPVDLREVLDSSVSLLSNQIQQHAQIERSFQPILPIAGVASRLGQVFVNLLSNGIQAIDEAKQPNGLLQLRTYVDDIDGWVVAEVQDNGGGMTPEVISRIFEPFFTTKQVGVGTGLGLSICYGIITNLGGTISLDSVEGLGTTFTVRFPAASELKPEAVVSDPKPILNDDLRILVVDDDTSVSKVFTRLLSGHRIQTADSSSQGLALLTGGAELDIILCDVMMPEQTGVDFYEAVGRDHPRYLERIIFITGGTFTDREDAFLVRIPNLCLAKPVSKVTLEAAILKTLRRVQHTN
jgi:signal transduction histidine kinase/CheY-like chemotaxis protein